MRILCWFAAFRTTHATCVSRDRSLASRSRSLAAPPGPSLQSIWAGLPAEASLAPLFPQQDASVLTEASLGLFVSVGILIVTIVTIVTIDVTSAGALQGLGRVARIGAAAARMSTRA